MDDLRCSEHDVPLVFAEPESRLVCPAREGCLEYTLADVLAMVNGLVGYVSY